MISGSLSPAGYQDRFVINVALTGAVADFRKNPNVPITAPDVVAQVAACQRAGAAIAHIHVRDEDGNPSTDAARFAAILGPLRENPSTAGMILCATTSGRHGQTLEQRMAVLDLPRDIRPDMASLTLSSVNFVTGASINAPDTIRRLCEKMRAAGVRPELEVFDIGMAMFLHQLVEEGLLEAPFYVNVLLGNIAGTPVDALQFGALRAALPADAIVAIAGLGRYQLQANLLGVAAADGVRVGLEDNLWADNRRTPATNVGLVERIAAIATLAQRRIATPDSLRGQLALPRRTVG